METSPSWRKASASLGIPGEDAALPGGPGDDVVQGAAAGVVIPRSLDHQPVGHPVMRALVLAVARVVALPDLGHDSYQGLPAVIVVGSVMDDDHVEIGLLVPAAHSPGAEEDDGLGLGLDRQVPAETDCGRVGSRVDHRGHLLADTVSSHRAAWRLIRPAGMSTGGLQVVISGGQEQVLRRGDLGR